MISRSKLTSPSLKHHKLPMRCRSSNCSCGCPTRAARRVRPAPVRRPPRRRACGPAGVTASGVAAASLSRTGLQARAGADCAAARNPAEAAPSQAFYSVPRRNLGSGRDSDVSAPASALRAQPAPCSAVPMRSCGGPACRGHMRYSIPAGALAPATDAGPPAAHHCSASTSLRPGPCRQSHLPHRLPSFLFPHTTRPLFFIQICHIDGNDSREST
jgi:hypothetical protein